MLRVLAVLLWAGVFAGCATTVTRARPKAVRFAEQAPVEMTPLVEALLGFTGTRISHLAGTWREEAFVADAVMKGDGKKLTIVFLAPQMRLATITLTRPHALVYTRAPQIPALLDPEYVLADVAFAHLPTEVLRQAGAGAFAVADDGVTRRVTLPDGTCLAELVRAADGSATYRNPLYGYEYTLRVE